MEHYRFAHYAVEKLTLVQIGLNEENFGVVFNNAKCYAATFSYYYRSMKSGKVVGLHFIWKIVENSRPQGPVSPQQWSLAFYGTSERA